MNQKKFEILGPYTSEHEGPFCTRGGRPVDLRIRDGRGSYPLIGYIGDSVSAHCWRQDGVALDGAKRPNDLMNAREVPVAQEFWVNEYVFGEFSVYTSEGDAKVQELAKSYVRTIHVREVLPGEGE